MKLGLLFFNFQVKREISGDQQAGGIQGDNGIFPKYPGDEEVEFETEVEQPGQEQDKDKLEQFPKEEGSVNPEFPVVDQESVSGGQSQETTGQETGSSETFGQEQEGDKKLDEVGGGQVSEQDGIVVDATTEGYKPHKPWYKKVHGFFKNQYDYLKQRLGRGDYYVNT